MVRINAVFPEDMIKVLDLIAKKKNKSRSMLLREATEQLIEEYRRQAELEQRKARIKASIDVQEKLRKKSGKWNGVAEIRKWREGTK